ncbi:hypothetical protein P691DRAFT_786531, partial [Macrolepiota fuliginosa MF-IS2]
YTGIISLVMRQIFAAMDIMIPSTQSGQFNNSDIKIVMKDMALLYFGSTLARDILVPLLDFQSSSSYQNPYAAPYLGITYPVISGNANDTKTLAMESACHSIVESRPRSVVAVLGRNETTY